jgi:outer membrane cobalamin receptor
MLCITPQKDNKYDDKSDKRYIEQLLELNKDLKLNLRLNNLLNKDYALAYDTNKIVTPFQTPGASFFINLRYELQ